MTKTILASILTTILLTTSSSAEAQQGEKIPRIGFLQRRVPPTPTNPDPLGEAFLQGLRDLGYVDGKNIHVERRYAEGMTDRLPALVAELGQLKLDVLIVPGFAAIRAAKQATKTVPIVMITTADPVAAGLIDSLARPGGNITGLTRLTRDLRGKRLEVLKEAVPGVTRIGILAGSSTTDSFEDFESAARAQKMTSQILEVNGQKPDFDGAFQAAVKGRVNGLVTVRDGLTASFAKRIANLAIKSRLPSNA
jgi:putative ABC transport system substrate-binding protein